MLLDTLPVLPFLNSVSFAAAFAKISIILRGTITPCVSANLFPNQLYVDALFPLPIFTPIKAESNFLFSVSVTLGITPKPSGSIKLFAVIYSKRILICCDLLIARFQIMAKSWSYSQPIVVE